MNSEEREREKLRIQELKKKWRVSPRKKQKRFQKDSYVVRTNPSMYHMYRMKKKKEGKLDEVPPRNLFAQVVFKFLYMILEKVISQGYIFHMPYKLGSIRLNKVKYKCRSKFAFSSDRLAVKAWDYSYSIFDCSLVLTCIGPSKIRRHIKQLCNFMMTTKSQVIIKS